MFVFESKCTITTHHPKWQSPLQKPVEEFAPSRMCRTLFILVFLLLVPQTGLAHKLHVFAWAEDGVIHGETAFQRGTKARNVTITIEDAASTTKLTRTTSDANGVFSSPIPDVARQEPIDLRIIADAGSGHRSEWLMKASEYATTKALVQPKKTTGPSGVHSNIEQHTDTIKHIGISETTLRAIVREEVAAQLGTIRKMIVRHSDRGISLQDILGGLGYIMGITGLATYIIYRKEKKK